MEKTGGPDVSTLKNDANFKANCQKCFESKPCKTHKVKRKDNGKCTKCQWTKWSAPKPATCLACDVSNRIPVKTRSLVADHTDVDGMCEGSNRYTETVDLCNPCGK